MKLIQKYVLREFLLPFVYCFATFYGLFALSTLFSTFAKLSSANATAWFAAQYLIDYMSPYVVYLLPASLMLATLYTMWRFCHHSEIIAMRANGLSYTMVTAPILAVAAGAALCCALNQEFYAPRGRERARRVEENRFHPPPPAVAKLYYRDEDARRTWRVDRVNLDDPRVLDGVRISIDRADGTKAVDILSQRAEHLDGVWWLIAPQYRYFDEHGSPASPPDTSKPLLLLTVRPMPHFQERPRDFAIEGKVGQAKDVVEQHEVWQWLSLRDMLWWLNAHPQSTYRDRLCAAHMRIAMPWACIVITLFAIPAGVATGRQSVFLGVLLAIALFFGFYLSILGCKLLAANGVVAPWLAAWLPNFAFLGAGLRLFAKLR